MTKTNKREKKLASMFVPGYDDPAEFLAGYRAELLKPKNVMREAERLLRAAAPLDAEYIEATLWLDGSDEPEHEVITNLRVVGGADYPSIDSGSLDRAYAALVQSGKGE